MTKWAMRGTEDGGHFSLLVDISEFGAPDGQKKCVQGCVNSSVYLLGEITQPRKHFVSSVIYPHEEALHVTKFEMNGGNPYHSSWPRHAD